MKALCLVDLQNDFFPGGALPVPQGDRILPIVNRLLHLNWDVVVASKDWHPPEHKSFAAVHEKEVGDTALVQGEPQILWPVHCVQGTKGAEFKPGFETDRIEKIVYKGTRVDSDSYSAFFDDLGDTSSGLKECLAQKKVEEIFFAGLATDYCVRATVLDGLALGFRCAVVKEGVRGVNLGDHDSEKALEEMAEAGATILSIDDVEKMRYNGFASNT